MSKKKPNRNWKEYNESLLQRVEILFALNA